MKSEEVRCSVCKSTYNVMFLLGKQGNADICPVCGGKLNGDAGENTKEDAHSDWVTWWYYGFKNDNGKSGSLRDKPIDLDKFGDTYFLIQEFQAPPRDENGSEKAKAILRTFVPDAFAPAKENTVRCPRCFCSDYTLMNRGYGLLTGFLWSGRVKRVCNRCKKEF